MNRVLLANHLMNSGLPHGGVVIRNLFRGTYTKAQEHNEIVEYLPKIAVKMAAWLDLGVSELRGRIISGKMKRYLYIAALNQALKETRVDDPQ